MRLNAGRTTGVKIREGHMAALVVQRGALRLNGAEAVKAVDVALFSRTGECIAISADEESMALLLPGKPIDEPVIAQGLFVMNTQQEIQEAIHDFQSGRMGRIGVHA